MNTSNTNFADQLLANLFNNNGSVEPPILVNQNGFAVSTEAKQLAQKSGLDWTVSKQPLTWGPENNPTPFYGIVRDDTKTTFATMKEGYEIFQNDELAELVIRLAEKTGFGVAKGGSFNGGGKVWYQLKSPNKLSNIGSNRDTVNGFITGINSHDGSTSLKWGETNVTISCMNTFMYASKSLKNRAKHTANMMEKIELALKEITGIVKAEKNLFESFAKLAEIPYDKTITARVVKEITGIDPMEKNTKITESYSKQAIAKAELLTNSIASEAHQKGATLWGLFSGVTQYTTHRLNKNHDDDQRLESTYTGKAFDLNMTAFSTIADYAKLELV